MATYPASVEQWRPLVAQYFPPELVDKALWVIQHESGGDPNNPGDNGVARGLFQIQDNRNFPSRPNAAWLDNPENNIRYAAEQLGAAHGNWAPWGEGVLYQGKPFGALGRFPYPDTAPGNVEGDTLSPKGGSPAMPTPEGLPPGTETIGPNLARYLDPATGSYIYFRNNPQPYLDPNTNQIVPAGWVPAGSLPQPSTTPADASKNIKVGKDGLAYVVDNQGNIVRRAPEFDDPATAKAQGAVTTQQLQQNGAKIGVGVATLNGKEYKQNADGTWTVSGDAASAKPSAIQSVFNALPGAQGAYSSSASGAGGGSTGGSSSVTPLTPTTGSRMAPGFNGLQYDPLAPAPGTDAGGMPIEGYGMQPGKSGTNSFLQNLESWGTGRSQMNSPAIIAAAGGKPTFNPADDAATAAGIEATRALVAAQGYQPAQIQEMLDAARFGVGPGRNLNYGNGTQPNVGGNLAPTGANYSYSYGSTAPANGKGPIPFNSSDYEDWLKSLTMANGGAMTQTNNPAAIVDMVTGETLGMFGGTGKEKATIEPVGEHGTPRQEMMVGSKLWPDKLGVGNAYADGIDDIMKGFGLSPTDPGVQTTVDYRPVSADTYSAPAGDAATPYTSQMPRGGDPDVAGSQGPSFGGTNPSGPAHDKIELPYMYPMNPYLEDIIIGPALQRMLEKAGFPGGMASLLNAPDEVRSRLLGPRALAYVNERASPGLWHDQQGGATLGSPSPMNDWMSRYFSTLPRSGRDMYQAGGGTNTAGSDWLNNPQHPQQWGMGGLDDMFTFMGLDRGGAFDGARANWENYTPLQQQNAWSYMSLPGMGNPWSGNHWLPGLTFGGMYNGRGYSLPYDGNLAPTPYGTYAELQPSVFHPPANMQTFLNTPVGQNPTGGIVNQVAGPPTGAKGPVTMADGGMGQAGGMMADPAMGGGMNMRQTDPMLLQALSAGLNKRIKMTLPVAA